MTASAIGGEVILLAVILILAFMQWHNRLPPIEKVVKLIDALNTKGGNLLILSGGAILGSWASLRLLYYVLERSQEGKLTQDNSFAMLGISFITGNFTGGFLATLFKTMTGESSKSHPETPTSDAE